MLRLLIDGPGGQREFASDAAQISAGRAPDNDLVLDDNSISRHHARLLRQGAAVSVRDLGSANGTGVAGRVLHNESAPLPPGTSAQIGPYTLRLVEAPAQPSHPTLSVSTPNGVFVVTLAGDEAVIGRDPASDVRVDAPAVSLRHALIRRVGESWQLADLQSRNGTVVGGQRVDTAPLQDGALFQLAPDVTVRFSLPGNMARPTRSPSAQASTPTARPGDAAHARGTIHPPAATRITVGRDPSNDLTLESPQVSRRHAVFERTAPGSPWAVTDLNSTNHTFVNGVAVTRQQLGDGDVVRIGPYRLAVHGASIEQHDETDGYLLEALDLTTVVAHGKTILDNVSFVARPAEFVAIVGGSGAGKSTLMGALSGLRPATRGQVLLNGFPLYAHFDAFRAQIGYVPQDDIIHRELTAGHALAYAAQLRMPTDTGPAERAERVRQVLEELALTPHRDTPIGRLSGGQRKRVSIGVELLTSPPLFFLDEPTSGLDPGAEARMMELLRRLADGGRTVILITHATRNIALCDKVCFMAEGGRLAFFGTPEEALAHFGVSAFEDIYQQVEDTGTAEGWAEKFSSSRACTEHLTGPLNYRRGGAPPPTAMPAQIKPPPAAEALRQFWILARRYAEIMLNDRKNLAILLLQAPIIAVLVWFVAANAFDPGQIQPSMNLASTLALTAVWLGSLNAIREISKEDGIYRRERRVNLSVVAYVGSKLAVLFVLVVVQATILVVVTGANLHFPGNGAFIETWLTLVLTGAASVAIALAISAAVSNPDRAVFIAPIVLLPQIFFQGIIKPVAGATQIPAALVPARWGFEAIGRATDIVKLVPPNRDFGQRDALTGHAIVGWIGLLLIAAVCAPLAVGLQRLKDRR